MKSFRNQTNDVCMNCKHWLKLEKQHSSRRTGYCRKYGNKQSLVSGWDVTYADSTCVSFTKRKK